jgi:hypothetical protein
VTINGRCRDESLNESWFVDLADARATIEEWRGFYNTQRPHSDLGNMPPARYRSREQSTAAYHQPATRPTLPESPDLFSGAPHVLCYRRLKTSALKR